MGFRTNARVELSLGGMWTDVTDYVYERDPISITRGRAGSATGPAEPASLTFTLDNRDGRFSPRNPTSPYFGVLGRNTPVRVSLPYGNTALTVTEGVGSGVETTDKPALDVTGDIDLRADIDANSWRGGEIMGKYFASGTDRSWIVTVNNYNLGILWSPNGTLEARKEAFSTAQLPNTGRVAVRVTLDVDNGAGGWTARFWTAPTMAGPWTQLGADVNGTGVTSIASTGTPVQIGEVTGINERAVWGRYFSAEIRNGIGGTVVASPDFSSASVGAASVTDAQGNVWTVRAETAVSDRRWRFHGEISKWPQAWDVSGRDRYVKVQGYGIRRRLTLNAPALHSTMYREHVSPARTSIVGYWPLEDSSNSTSFAGARPGVQPGRIEGTPALASYDGWTASDPIPEVRDGRLTFVPPYRTPNGTLSVRMFLYIAKAITQAETSLLYLETTENAPKFDVLLKSDGSLRVQVADGYDVLLHDTIVTFKMNQRGFVILQVDMVRNFTTNDLHCSVKVTDFNNDDTIEDGAPVPQWNFVMPGRRPGYLRKVVVGRDRGLGTGSVIVGHLMTSNDVNAWSNTLADIAAYNGETPENRITRLCAEEGVPFRLIRKGSIWSNAALMGDQRNNNLVGLLDEAAETDMGILTEPREFAGFTFRPRTSLVNQNAAIRLDYRAGHIAGDLRPVDDDDTTLNDITVSRNTGSSLRVEQASGPMSVQPPPNGVGRYSTEVGVSLERDELLTEQAGFRLRRGTVDEVRYPELSVKLHSPRVTDAMADELLRLDLGDRIDVGGFGVGLPPDDVSQMVEGYTESLRIMEYEITYNLSPYSPWVAAVTDQSRADTDGTTVAGVMPKPTDPYGNVVASWSGVGLADGTVVTNTTAGPGDRAFSTVTTGAFTVDAVAAPWSFADDFEDGNLTGWANTTPAVSVVAAAARTGALGMRQAANATQAGVASLNDATLPNGYAWADVRFDFRQVAHTSGNSPILTVQNRTGTDHADLFVNYNAGGVLGWDLTAVSGKTASLDLSVWRSYRVVVGFGANTWTMRLWIDGVEQTAAVATGKAPSDVQAMHFGGFGTDVNERHFDNIQVTLSEVNPLGTPPAAAPRIRMDQQAGAAAQLIWTGLGTLAEYAIRARLELSAYPSAGARLMSVHLANTSLSWYVDVTSAGIMRLRDPGGTAVALSGTPIPIGRELFVEAIADDGTVTVTVYDGSTSILSVASRAVPTTLEQVRFGSTTTAPTWPRLWWDEMSVRTPGAGTGTLFILTPDAPRWSVNPADYPADVRVAGERMTVTAAEDASITPNAFFNVDAAGWGGASATVARVTSPKPTGAVASLQITPNGTDTFGGAGSPFTAQGAITPGMTYTGSFWAYSPVLMPDMRPAVNWYNAAGTFLSTTFPPNVALYPGGWRYIEADMLAPANATMAAVWAWHGGKPTHAYYVWGVRLVPVFHRSLQVLTVQRAVNGVRKAQAEGTAVSIWDPRYPGY
ncbi:hypothetical protein SMC26_39460 [Actinomadura fulvescens]|uniref:Minor tail protein n=1 Tax=Actinomadura fulvescens TaxID=46160 RepID=A0ABP6CD87_9ACTN